MLLAILIVLLILAAGGGLYGGPRGWGYAGWSPLGLIILIVIVLALTGNLGDSQRGSVPALPRALLRPAPVARRGWRVS